ncbi:MAG: hypothetical protein ABW170_01270 [Candidatus Thiodiazotropha sp. L084R]
MTRTAGALIGRRRSSAFWGLGCPKTHHEIKDSLVLFTTALLRLRPQDLWSYKKLDLLTNLSTVLPLPWECLSVLY